MATCLFFVNVVTFQLMFTFGTIITQMHRAGRRISIQRSRFCHHILKKSRVREWAFNQPKKPKSFAIVSNLVLFTQSHKMINLIIDGKYENTNVWKHSGSQYRVHGHVEFDLPVALGEWEVQLVFDDGRKMVIMETPQMIKNDRSTDGQYWSFRAQEYNQVLFSKNVKFFVQGAMWRTAPGPRSSKFRLEK